MRLPGFPSTPGENRLWIAFLCRSCLVDLLEGLVIPFCCRYMKEGFISTSIAGKAAFSGKNVQFEIVARKGTPALGVAHQSSVGTGENEILMRHGQAFEIYEIEEKSGHHVVKMFSLI